MPLSPIRRLARRGALSPIGRQAQRDLSRDGRRPVTTSATRPTECLVEATDSELMILFAAWREDIDSEPFAYETYWMTISRQLNSGCDG